MLVTFKFVTCRLAASIVIVLVATLPLTVKVMAEVVTEGNEGVQQVIVEAVVD